MPVRRGDLVGDFMSFAKIAPDYARRYPTSSPIFRRSALQPVPEAPGEAARHDEVCSAGAASICQSWTSMRSTRSWRSSPGSKLLGWRSTELALRKVSRPRGPEPRAHRARRRLGRCRRRGPRKSSARAEARACARPDRRVAGLRHGEPLAPGRSRRRQPARATKPGKDGSRSRRRAGRPRQAPLVGPCRAIMWRGRRPSRGDANAGRTFLARREPGRAMPAKAERRTAMRGASAVGVSIWSATQALPSGSWKRARRPSTSTSPLAHGVPGAHPLAVARGPARQQAEADPVW